MTKLSVNLNKVALLRNQRDIGYPDVLEFARIVIDAGADGITVHPRPDERHITVADTYALAELVRNEYGGRVEYNIEGKPTEDYMNIVRDIVPDQATLVPDEPDQRTSDHGWDPDDEETAGLAPILAELSGLGIRTSLFLNSEPAFVTRIHNLGPDRVELYTGPWADAYGTESQAATLKRYADCAKKALELGIGVNAGHDLNLENLPSFVAAVPGVDEVSIGHAITSDALKMGFAEAVRAYQAILKS